MLRKIGLAVISATLEDERGGLQVQDQLRLLYRVFEASLSNLAKSFKIKKEKNEVGIEIIDLWWSACLDAFSGNQVCP